jgi:four helix bundle protein
VFVLVKIPMHKVCESGNIVAWKNLSCKTLLFGFQELEQVKLQTIARQLIRCGTAVGALTAEASEAESADDFIHKMKIALKEAKESMYWLDIVKGKVSSHQVLVDDLVSIQKIITRSIQTARHNRDLKRKDKPL